MPNENEALKNDKKLTVDFRELSLTGSTIYHGAGIIDYNPDSLVGRKGLEIYSKMREDDQIKAVLTMKKFARLMTSWSIQPASEDSMDVEIADFVKINLENMAGTFEDNLLNIYTGLDYGFSITEKLFYRIEKGKYTGKIGLKELKTREPFYYGFESDEFGNLKEYGVIYMGPTSTELRKSMNEQQNVINNTAYGYRLPKDKFVIYSYNKEFSNLYGCSDLRAAYRSWFSKDILIKFMNIYMERFGIPTTIGKYPKGTSKADRTAIKTALDRMQAKYSIIVPSDMEVELINAAAGGGEAFKSAIEMHNKFMSRSILVPDLMGFNEIAGGAYALGKKHFDVFLWMLQKLGRDTEESIVGEQIIKQLVDYNYSNVDSYPKFKFESITAEGTATRANIVQMGVAGGFINPEEEWIREYLALPKSDPSKPLGMPKEQLPGGLGGVIPEKIGTQEGLKDAEDKNQDDLESTTEVAGQEGLEDEEKFVFNPKAFKRLRQRTRKFAKSEFIDVNKIIPNQEQQKIVDHQRVASMIAVLNTGGDLAPVVIDKDNNLLEGHHRLTAYKKVGRKEIPFEIKSYITAIRVIPKGEFVSFIKSSLPLDKRFDYKIDFAKMKEDLDEYEVETVDALSKIVQQQKDSLLKFVEKKQLVENKDYNAVNSLQLKFVGDFKDELHKRLIKLYLDSKLEVLREIAEGSDNIEITTKFANITIQPWIPVQPADAIDFFNRKVNAKIIKEDGTKTLLTLATAKELKYYDAIAFAISGIERDNILKQAKLIILNGIKIGDAKGTQFALGKLFDTYLTTGEIEDEELITSYRLETIVRTNFAEALNAGRTALMNDEDVKDFVPYRQYKAILDDRVRPTHAEMHNKIFRSDDPIWGRIDPPNGFNCRCLSVPITKAEISRLMKDGEGIELSTEDDIPTDFPDAGFGKYSQDVNAIVVKNVEIPVSTDKEKMLEDERKKQLDTETLLLAQEKAKLLTIKSDIDAALSEIGKAKNDAKISIAEEMQKLNAKFEELNAKQKELSDLQAAKQINADDANLQIEQLNKENAILKEQLASTTKVVAVAPVENVPKGEPVVKTDRKKKTKPVSTQILDIVKCPYPNCGSTDLNIEKPDAEGTITTQCNSCQNMFKVTSEGDVYLHDKVKDEWIKQDYKILPVNITGDK